MVTLAFAVTVEDFEAFNLQFTNSAGKRAKRLRGSGLFLLAMATVLTAFYAWSGVLNGEFDLLLLFGLPLGPPMIAFVVMEALRPWVMRIRIRSLLGREPQEAFLGKIRLEATEAGLTITGETTTTHCTWAAIKGIDETARHIFVKVGNAAAVIIPKRDQTATSLDALRQLLDASIGAGAA